MLVIKITISLLFSTFLLGGCVSNPSISSDYDKFTGISKSELKGVDVKTKEGVWLGFELTKGTGKKETDYFLTVDDITVNKALLADLKDRKSTR